MRTSLINSRKRIDMVASTLHDHDHDHDDDDQQQYIDERSMSIVAK